jgi:hypothetical protein
MRTWLLESFVGRGGRVPIGEHLLIADALGKPKETKATLLLITKGCEVAEGVDKGVNI